MAEGDALRSLLAHFFIDVDDEALKKGEKHVDGFVGTLKAAGTALLEAFAWEKVHEFFANVVEGAAHAQDLSDKLGLSVGALKQFQGAAATVGVEGDDAARSLGFLNRTVGEAITGNEEAQKTFGHLGVKVKDSSGHVRELEDILFDVSDAFEGMNSQQERAAFGMKLFGREGQQLVPVLMKGSEHLHELYEENKKFGAGLGSDFPQQARKAREEMEHFHKIIGAIKTRIVAAGLPAFTALYRKLQDLTLPLLEATKHTNILQHIMVTAGVAGTLKFVTSLVKLSKTLGLLKPSLVETVLSLLKFGGPLLIVGALALAFEDLWTLMEGGDSVIGDILVDMYGVEGAKQFVDDLRGSWDDIKALWLEIKPLGGELLKGLIEAVPVALKVVLGLVEGLAAVYDVLKGIVGVVGVAAGRAGDLLGGGMSEERVARAKARGEWTTQDEIANNLQKSRHESALNAVDAEAKGAGASMLGHLGVIGDLISGKQTIPDSGPAGVALGGGLGASLTQNNEIHVQVQGGDNPQQTGQIVGQGIATKLEREKYNALTALKKN